MQLTMTVRTHQTLYQRPDMLKKFFFQVRINKNKNSKNKKVQVNIIRITLSYRRASWMTTSTATELWTGWPRDDRAPLMACIDEEKANLHLSQRSVLL